MNINEREQLIRQVLDMGDVDLKEVSVTPEIARQLLLFNSHNRVLSNTTVKKYAMDITKGRWDKSNDMITFDDKWETSNGQHRLHGIIEAGKPVKLVICFHVNQSCEMDRGKQRTISENIRLTDIVNNKELRDNKKIHEVMNTALKTINYTKYVRTDDLAELMNKYEKELIESVTAGLFNGANGVGQAAISASFFAAYVNGIPLETLMHIRLVLNDGLAKEERDKPIIGLRDKLLALHGGGAGLNSERARYTQYCIQSVVTGKKTKTCKSGELFYRF